jgi:hypothetical protein
LGLSMAIQIAQSAFVVSLELDLLGFLSLGY